jgi:hypothetical protein
MVKGWPRFRQVSTQAQGCLRALTHGPRSAGFSPLHVLPNGRIRFVPRIALFVCTFGSIGERLGGSMRGPILTLSGLKPAPRGQCV